MQPEAENSMSETNIVENRKTQGKTNGKEKRDQHITNCIELKFQSVPWSETRYTCGVDN